MAGGQHPWSSALHPLSCIAGLLSSTDQASLRASCRAGRDAVDATLLVAQACLSQPPRPPRWEHWLSLRRLVLTLPRVYPAGWSEQQLPQQVAALGLERLPALPAGGCRVLELCLARPKHERPATSLRRLHHAMAATGALARFSAVVAQGPAQVDSSFEGRLVAAEVRLDTCTPYPPGEPADAFARLERLTLLVSRRSQQALLQRWLAADTLPACTQLAVSVEREQFHREQAAVTLCEEMLRPPARPATAPADARWAAAYRDASHWCLTRQLLDCECRVRREAHRLPLLLLLPDTPRPLGDALVRSPPPLQCGERGLRSQPDSPALPSTAAAAAVQPGEALSAQRSTLAPPPPVPRLLSQLHALELTDLHPAGGLAALARLTQLTRLHLHIEFATHECGYEYSCDRGGTTAALTALTGLAALSIDGLYNEDDLDQLCGLTELRVQQAASDIPPEFWGEGWLGPSLCGLTALQRLTVKAQEMKWTRDEAGHTRQLLGGALAAMPGLRQLTVERWYEQAASWRALCLEFILPVLADAPSLELLHLPGAVAPGPATDAGCHRFVTPRGAAYALRWAREHAGNEGPNCCEEQAAARCFIWDIRAERAARGASPQPGAVDLSLKAALGGWLEAG